jgi:hypothetical protein
MYSTQLPSIIESSTLNKPIGSLPPGEYTGTLSLDYIDEGTVLAKLLSEPWPMFFDRWRVGPPPYSVEWRRARAGLFPSLTMQQLISGLRARGLAAVLQGVPVKFWIKETHGYKIVSHNNNYMATINNQSVSGWKPSITAVETQMRSVSIPTIYYNLVDIMATRDLTIKLKERIEAYDNQTNTQSSSRNNNSPTIQRCD